MDVMDFTNTYTETNGYVKDKEDIIVRYDGYICIVERAIMNNIVFVKCRDTHKHSLFYDVVKIIDLISTKYNINLITVNNKKWEKLILKTGIFRKAADINNEVQIYERIH